MESAKTRGLIGASPSGKASVFGTDIPRFESWRPSQSSVYFGCFVRRGGCSERRADDIVISYLGDHKGLRPNAVFRSCGIAWALAGFRDRTTACQYSRALDQSAQARQFHVSSDGQIDEAALRPAEQCIRSLLLSVAGAAAYDLLIGRTVSFFAMATSVATTVIKISIKKVRRRSKI